jgi:hypothetical protein
MKLGAIEFAPPASDVAGTVNFTNVTTGVTTSSNLNVGGTLMLGTVEVVGTPANTANLHDVVNLGNVTSNTVQFTNAITSLTAASNVVVTGNVTAGSFLGDGSELTALNAANIGSGTLPVSRGGTSTTSSTGTGALVLQNAPSLTGDLTVSGVAKFQNIYYFARASLSGNFQNSGSATYINVHQRSNGGLVSTDSGTKIQLNTSDANGVYMVWCSVSIKTDSGQGRGFEVSLVKGNTVFASGRCNINHITNSTYTQIVCSGLINLTSGDKVYHQTASGHRVHGPDTNFYMYRISS